MADTSTALPYLVRRISEVVEGDPGLRRKLEERASKYREVHQEVRRRWEEQLRRRWDERTHVSSEGCLRDVEGPLQ